MLSRLRAKELLRVAIVSDTAKHFFLYDPLASRLPGGTRSFSCTSLIGLNRLQHSNMARREITPINHLGRRFVVDLQAQFLELDGQTPTAYPPQFFGLEFTE